MSAFPPPVSIEFDCTSSSDDDTSIRSSSSQSWIDNKNKMDLEVPLEIELSFDKVPSTLKISDLTDEIWYDDDQSFPFLYDDLTAITEQGLVILLPRMH